MLDISLFPPLLSQCPLQLDAFQLQEQSFCLQSGFISFCAETSFSGFVSSRRSNSFKSAGKDVTVEVWWRK
jgi:hypothetical protein